MPRSLCHLEKMVTAGSCCHNLNYHQFSLFSMKHYLLLLPLALVVLATACKKDDSVPNPTVTQKLIAKKWQLRSASISAPSSPTIDLYALSLPCSLDDVTQYTTPNTVSYDEGPTKCDPLDPQTQTATWALSKNDTQLTITSGSTSNSFTIDELTDSALTLSYVQIQSGVTATIKTSYSPVP